MYRCLRCAKKFTTPYTSFRRAHRHPLCPYCISADIQLTKDPSCLPAPHVTTPPSSAGGHVPHPTISAPAESLTATSTGTAPSTKKATAD